MGVSGLDALVGAATEGMRKTQSADEILPEVTEPAPAPAKDGHLSDSAVAPTRERKKGVPWTEDEHRLFLLGLQKLGKGDWRGISRHFVQSRTPTQVASHAQKYFIRQNNVNKRKRRSSLFDIVGDPTSADAAPSVDAKGPAPQVGGLSMAFAGQMGGYNPAAMAAPPAFVAKGSAAGETDVGAAGEAAAATIAALSMAGSPAATAGYQAAAAAASSAPARFPAVTVPPATAGRDAAAAQAAQAAQAQQGFAAMMAQMGAMGQMNPGAMGSFPPAAANWMLTYQHFLQQITAAAQQHQAAPPGAGPGAMPPFGLSFPPFGAAATPAGSLFRPTALHAAQPTAAPVVSGAPAAPAAQATSEEKTAVAA